MIRTAARPLADYGDEDPQALAEADCEAAEVTEPPPPNDEPLHWFFMSGGAIW